MKLEGGSFPLTDTETLELLEQLTAAYNKKVAQNRAEGLLDFVPKDITPKEMLKTALAEYALSHYPEVLGLSAETTPGKE